MWFGFISRYSSVAKTILEGKFKGRQKKKQEDNFKDWTGKNFYRHK